MIIHYVFIQILKEYEVKLQTLAERHKRSVVEELEVLVDKAIQEEVD